MTETIKLDFEKICLEMAGQSIARVSYVNLISLSDADAFDILSFDFLDFGVELELENGNLLSISWGTEFIHYGISLRKNPLSQIFDNTSSLDVGKRKYWHHLLHNPIRCISVYWHTLISNDVKKIYPQDLEILFESGDVIWMGARMYISTRDILMPFSDEITIIFDDEVARKYHVGKYLK